MDWLRKNVWLGWLHGLRDVVTRPGLDMQLFLTALAVILGFLFSLLIQRLVARKFPKERKYNFIGHALVPSMLSPILVLFACVVADWVSAPLVSGHRYVIEGAIKIVLVWLVARALLLITQRHVMAYVVSVVMLAVTLLSVTGLLLPTQTSLNDIAFESGNFRLSLLGAIKGVFTMFVLFWGASIFAQTSERWLRQTRVSFNARELAAKFLRLALYFLASVLTLNEMGVDLTALTVLGGAFAVGLGFGFQRITSNFISGIVLLFEKTIQAGDLIEVGGERGWVRKMAIRHTMIETADGREMLIPNEDLIIGKVTNWTYTNTRARIDILLTLIYGTDVEKTKTLLLATAQSYPHCISDPPPLCFLREFGERGLQFQLAFWIPDIQAGLASAKSDVMFRIVHAFKEHGIEFAVLK